MLHPESDAEFTSNVLANGDKLIVIDFFATWCGPCKRIAPEFARLGEFYSDCCFMKVDGDKCKMAMMQYGVKAYPSFVILKGGKMIELIRGGNMKRLVSVIDANRVVRPKTPELAYRHFPCRGYTSFDLPKFDKLMGKLLEYNEKTASPLNPGQIKEIQGFIEVLKNENFYHASEVSHDAVACLSHSIKAWEDEYCFPLVDLCVGGLRHPSFAKIFAASFARSFLASLIPRVTPDASPFPLKLLCVRLLCNMLAQKDTRKVILGGPSLIATIGSFTGQSKASLRHAVATLCLNFAISVVAVTKAAKEKGGDTTKHGSAKEAIGQVIYALLQDEFKTNKVNTITTCALATGTLLTDDAVFATGEAAMMSLAILGELAKAEGANDVLRACVEDLESETERVVAELAGGV